MPNTKIDQLVENFFNPKEKQTQDFSISELFSLIKEVENTLPFLKEAPKSGRVPLGGPPAQPAQKSAASARTISLSAIPEISVSELGWATLSTSDSGDQISSPQRTQLQQYLANIGGTSFADKIKSVSDLFNMTDEQIQTASFLQGDTNSDKVQKTLAYLVFLKTLTTIITNFNAASAGFSFEAFLGVLLGGKQVPTASGTIADLHAGDGTPISLKLYAEKSLSVGGSFTDLVGDMVKPKTSVQLMRYIVATKDLAGEGLDRAGSIKVYQFDIDIENIYDVMVKSQNNELIQLPEGFIQNPQEFDASNLKKQKITIEQDKIEKVFYDSLVADLNKDYADIIFNSIKNEADDIPVFKTTKEEFKKLGASSLSNAFVANVATLIQANTQTQIDKKQSDQIKNIVKSADVKCRKFVEEQTGSAVSKEREIQLAQLTFATPQASYELYKKLPVEMKKKALLNTYGFLHTEQFEMTRNQVFNVIGGNEPIGTIQIGAKNLQDTINKLASNLNDTIFDIFSSLSVLTTNINTYFATGLRDSTAADQAQTAAQNIDKKTEEIKKART